MAARPPGAPTSKGKEVKPHQAIPARPRARGGARHSHRRPRPPGRDPPTRPARRARLEQSRRQARAWRLHARGHVRESGRVRRRRGRHRRRATPAARVVSHLIERARRLEGFEYNEGRACRSLVRAAGAMTMLSSLEIQQSHDQEARRGDVTRWRAICLFTLGALPGPGPHRVCGRHSPRRSPCAQRAPNGGSLRAPHVRLVGEPRRHLARVAALEPRDRRALAGGATTLVAVGRRLPRLERARAGRQVPRRPSPAERLFPRLPERPHDGGGRLRGDRAVSREPRAPAIRPPGSVSRSWPWR